MEIPEQHNKKSKLSDKEIFEGIRWKNRIALEFVYLEYFNKVYLNIVKGDFLDKEDAKDIFQDAMVILYKNFRKESFTLQYSFATYLYNVCKKLVMKRLRWEYKAHNIRAVSVDQIPEEDEKFLYSYPDISFDATEEIKHGLYYKYFSLLKDDCKKILKMNLSGTPYEEIANNMGYKQGTVAKSRRYQCKEYLVKSIKKDRLFQLLKDQ